MPGYPSILSLIGAGFYVTIALACIVAATLAIKHRQAPRHSRTWLALALFLGLLVTMRVLDVEELLRDALRDALRVGGSYDERRALQTPIAIGVIALAGMSLLLGFTRSWTRATSRRHYAMVMAQFSGFAMAALIAVRIVSLHGIDRMLYGPLKLNWIIDLGCASLIGASAIYYLVLVRQTRTGPG